MWKFHEKEIGVWNILVVYVSWIADLLKLFFRTHESFLLGNNMFPHNFLLNEIVT